MTENQLIEQKVRYDWYQNTTDVVLTIYMKRIKKEDLTINYAKNSIWGTIRISDQEVINIKFNVSHEIIPNKCSFRITPFKIEIYLRKSKLFTWKNLQSDAKQSKTIPAKVSDYSAAPAYPIWRRNKECSVVKEQLKEESSQIPDDDYTLIQLLQEVYERGSDEVKKAMNKSFTESKGTVLSTDWEEIGRGEVEVRPPDGVEFKKW